MNSFFLSLTPVVYSSIAAVSNLKLLSPSIPVRIKEVENLSSLLSIFADNTTLPLSTQLKKFAYC